MKKSAFCSFTHYDILQFNKRRKNSGTVTHDVKIPVGSTATVHVASSDEKFVRGSGEYTFRVSKDGNVSVTRRGD